MDGWMDGGTRTCWNWRMELAGACWTGGGARSGLNWNLLELEDGAEGWRIDGWMDGWWS